MNGAAYQIEGSINLAEENTVEEKKPESFMHTIKYNCIREERKKKEVTVLAIVSFALMGIVLLGGLIFMAWPSGAKKEESHSHGHDEKKEEHSHGHEEKKEADDGHGHHEGGNVEDVFTKYE